MPNQYTEPYDGDRTTGEQFRDWRHGHGWSRSHVAVMLRCTYETVARAEQRGTKYIPVTLQEVVKEFPAGFWYKFSWAVNKPIKTETPVDAKT